MTKRSQLSKYTLNSYLYLHSVSLSLFDFLFLLLQVICLLAGPNVQQLHSSRCSGFSLSFLYPSSIIQSMSSCLGLPLPLFPSILLSIISLCRELPLECLQSSSSALLFFI